LAPGRRDGRLVLVAEKAHVGGLAASEERERGRSERERSRQLQRGAKGGCQQAWSLSSFARGRAFAAGEGEKGRGKSD
jgi:hypothetical protein